MSRLPAPRRREQLLDVASELFAREGYARATTAELAKAAGVTEPIIYRHFASKRDLFVALIERTAERTLAHWEQSLANATDVGDRLRRLIGDNPMVSDTGRAPYRVFLQAITEVNDPEIQRAVTAHIKNLHSFLAREISRAQEEHRLTRVFSAELVAWTLIHIGLGYGLLDVMQVPGQGQDAQGGHVQSMLERLLTRRQSEE
ncbi:MAG TPA: TetR/AcrR family transcriptional regulator [Phycisphaerales bacterium]|nr:TetR/AcrR family transcriptional regulator [Phycisphaerales bacterium]